MSKAWQEGLIATWPYKTCTTQALSMSAEQSPQGVIFLLCFYSIINTCGTRTQETMSLAGLAW